MVNTEFAPLRMRKGTKRKVEALIYTLLWDTVSEQGKDMRDYEFLLGKCEVQGHGASVMLADDNPMGRLREALQLFEDHHIERDGDARPPVSDALQKIISAADRVEGTMSPEESHAIQCEIASAWEQAALVTGNQRLAHENGFDTMDWFK